MIIKVSRVDWKRRGLSRGSGISPVVKALTKVADAITEDAATDVETNRKSPGASTGSYRAGMRTVVRHRAAGYAVAKAVNASAVGHLVEYGSFKTGSRTKYSTGQSTGVMPALHPLKRASQKRRHV